MKLQFKGLAHDLLRTDREGYGVKIHCRELPGIACGVNPAAKQVVGVLSVHCKPIVAEDLKYNQELYMTVSTEPHNKFLNDVWLRLRDVGDKLKTGDSADVIVADTIVQDLINCINTEIGK